jgi:hypothetical protein
MPDSTRDLATVRSEVRSILEATPAFRAMAAPDQKALANAMVRVGSFLSKDDAGWLDGQPPPIATAQAAPANTATATVEKDPIGDLKQRLADKPDLVGKEFQAGAVREGVEQYGELVKKVDFPNFVSGLVNGVFKAVVDASIEQMKAYGELLAACAKTVDEFARDNITDGAARDQVRSKFPHLDDDDGEAALVAAAKVELARQRQSLMATMVLLGINRIVITNGQINAKVVFDMRAEDSAKRQATAELHDEAKSSSFAAEHNFSPMPWNVSANVSGRSQSHVATVESAVDDTSEAKAEVKAQLTGEVQLKFKSETFPLERMVSAGGLALLNARAEPPALRAGAAPAAAPAPAPAAPPPAQPVDGVRR